MLFQLILALATSKWSQEVLQEILIEAYKKHAHSFKDCTR